MSSNEHAWIRWVFVLKPYHGPVVVIRIPSCNCRCEPEASAGHHHVISGLHFTGHNSNVGAIGTEFEVGDGGVGPFHRQQLREVQ